MYKELHEKVGDRLPQVSDQSSTPYIMAVFHELERRVPSAVFNVPHFSSRDAEVGGYLIPKGTQVFVTYGCIQRDPEFFKVRNSQRL